MIGLGMDCSVDLAAVDACTAAGHRTRGSCSKLCTRDPSAGWGYAAVVWGYCACWLVAQDLAKLIAYRAFDAADPALAAQREQRRQMSRASQMSLGSYSAVPSSQTASARTTAGRSTLDAHRSTFDGSLTARSTLTGAADAMLEPAPPELAALPDMVSQLQARVRELEAALASGPPARPQPS